MTLSLYLPVAGRSPQRHATLSTQEIVHSTTPYYKALLQYFKVLQGTTPVLFRTSLCYKALLQYYCTTKYCSSTTLYYEVLLQYYKVGSWALPPRGASGHWVLWQSRSSTSQPKVMSVGESFVTMWLATCPSFVWWPSLVDVALASSLGEIFLVWRPFWVTGRLGQFVVKVFLTIMDACAHLCGDLLWLLWGFQQELLACCFLGFFVIIGIGYIGWWCIMCQATCAMGNCG